MAAPECVSTDSLCRAALDALHERFGGDLVSVALFGSRARNTGRSDSDADFLVVAVNLPLRRFERYRALDRIEEAVAASLGVPPSGLPRLDFILKPFSIAASPTFLYLDLVEDARILFDTEGFLAGVLDSFRKELIRRGAMRKKLGDGWYWILDRNAGPDCAVVIP